MLAAASNAAFFVDGRAIAPWRIYLGDAAEARLKTEGDRFVTSTGGSVKFDSADRNSQEDSKLATWTGAGKGTVFILGYASVDFSDNLSNGEAVVIDGSVQTAAAGKVTASFGSAGKNGTADITSLFAGAEPVKRQQFSVPLRCFANGQAAFQKVEMPLAITTDAPFALQIDGIRVANPAGKTLTCP